MTHGTLPSPLLLVTTQSVLPALRKIGRPRKIRWLFRIVTLLFLATPFGLAFVPWQQSLSGRGRVLALNPTERAQRVNARISGQIVRWHVIEGERVESGQSLVDIEDNDPERGVRLQKQKEFLKERLRESKEELVEQQRIIERRREILKATLEARRAAVEARKKSIEARSQSLKAAEVVLDRDEKELKIIASVVAKGNRPEIDLIRAQATRDRSRAEVERLNSELAESRAQLVEREAEVFQAQAAGEQGITEALRDENQRQQSVFNIEQQLQELDTQIERFNARNVKAPCAGIVFRIEANTSQGGAWVKEGDVLVTIVPDVQEKMVVELWVDGVDAPLIVKDEEGRYPHVRLQFEGWPAVQFVGWPSVARGTFGGRVILMDPTDNGKGQFRVLVEPDKLFPDDEDWPSQSYLRQGNQAVGWIFLNRVTIGWELWRRFNGFPPVIAPEDPDRKKSKDEGKPPKIKPG